MSTTQETNNTIAANNISEANKSICSAIANLSKALNEITLNEFTPIKGVDLDKVKQIRDEIKALNSLRGEVK